MSKFLKIGQKFSSIDMIWTITDIDEESKRVELTGETQNTDVLTADIDIYYEDFDFLLHLRFMIPIVP